MQARANGGRNAAATIDTTLPMHNEAVSFHQEWIQSQSQERNLMKMEPPWSNTKRHPLSSSHHKRSSTIQANKGQYP